MNQKPNLKQLRSNLLEARGLEKHKFNRPAPRPDIPDKKDGYTKDMVLTERLLGISLPDVLWLFPDSKLSEMLKISKSTVCRWRQKLLNHYKEDNEQAQTSSQSQAQVEKEEAKTAS